jgi:hypothetical protein
VATTSCNNATSRSTFAITKHRSSVLSANFLSDERWHGITPQGSNKLARPGLNTRLARTKATTATSAATQIIALSSHSYVRPVRSVFAGERILQPARFTCVGQSFYWRDAVNRGQPHMTAYRTGFALMSTI